MKTQAEKDKELADFIIKNADDLLNPIQQSVLNAIENRNGTDKEKIEWITLCMQATHDLRIRLLDIKTKFNVDFE